MPDLTEKEKISFIVKQTSGIHPVGLLVNLMTCGLIVACIYFYVFGNRALYGVVILLVAGLIVRAIIMYLLRIYLKFKYFKTENR